MNLIREPYVGYQRACHHQRAPERKDQRSNQCDDFSELDGDNGVISFGSQPVTRTEPDGTH